MFRLQSICMMLLVTGVLSLHTRPAHANVLWRGDFSTGDLSQWTGTEMVSADRLTVVPDPLGGLRKALKAIVIQGDNPIHDSGNRNELFYEGDDVSSGEPERWYHWQTLWPNDFQSANTWQLFTQWHQYQGGGSPPVEFFTWGNQIDLTILNDGDTPMWSTPLELGKWHDFLFHVKWSTDRSVGFIELIYDGQLAIPKHYCATLLSGGGGVYLKQGLYRDASVSQTQTIYHAGTTIGETEADVAPPPATKPATSTQATTSGTSPVAPTSTETASTTTTTTTTTSGAQGLVIKKVGCEQAGPGELGFVLLALGGLAGRIRRRR